MSTIRKMILAVASVVSVSTAQATVLTQPGYTDTQVAVLPGPSSNFYGNVAVDSNGNRYVTGGLSLSVYKVTPSGTVTTFATPVGGGLALGLDIIGNTLYMGSGNNISSVSLAGGPTTLLATMSGNAMGLTHTLDGQNLIVSTNAGVYKYNIATHTTTATSLNSGTYSAVATGLDGNIFLADYNNGKIVSYNFGLNTSANFRTGLSGVAGLAIDPVTGEIFAALENSATIDRISSDGSALVAFATNVAMDGGFFPTALEFAPNGGSLYFTQSGPGSAFNLHQISGFQTVTSTDVPEPASLALFGLGLAAVAFMRRRKV